MPNRGRFEVFEDRIGGWRWRLVAGNGEPIAQSEAYGSRTDAERGATDVRDLVVESEPAIVSVEREADR